MFSLCHISPWTVFIKIEWNRKVDQTSLYFNHASMCPQKIISSKTVSLRDHDFFANYNSSKANICRIYVISSGLTRNSEMLINPFMSLQRKMIRIYTAISNASFNVDPDPIFVCFQLSFLIIKISVYVLVYSTWWTDVSKCKSYQRSKIGSAWIPIKN